MDLKSNIQCTWRYEFGGLNNTMHLQSLIIIYIYSPISNVYKNTSSVGCTQYALYNLKQYDHNEILNDWIHITLLHTINSMC